MDSRYGSPQHTKGTHSTSKVRGKTEHLLSKTQSDMSHYLLGTSDGKFIISRALPGLQCRELHNTDPSTSAPVQLQERRDMKTAQPDTDSIVALTHH